MVVFVLSNLLPGATAATSLLLLVNGALFVFSLMLETTGVTGDGTPGLLRFDTLTLLRLGASHRALVFELGEVLGSVVVVVCHVTQYCRKYRFASNRRVLGIQ